MTGTQREAFEAWYVDNCPDIITEPIGCRTFTLQFGAWQAALTQPQAQQAKTGHDSDCSLHNEPAYPAGPCDCSQQAAAVPASPAKGSIELARSLCVDIAGPPDAAGDDTSGYGYGSVDVAEILSAEVVRLKALLSSAPAAPQAQGWLPIESAPKDGTNVLLVNRAGNIAAGLWLDSLSGSGWYLRGGCGGPDAFFNTHYGPTHYMPLPAPPIGITGGEEPTP